MTNVNNIKGSFPSQAREIQSRESLRNSHRFDFESYVNEASKSIKVSAHASERLNNRNINLSQKDLKSINSAMDKAEVKGAKEALILYNDLALIASVKNRTIITAIDKSSMEEKIFTNIDSAIII